MQYFKNTNQIEVIDRGKIVEVGNHEQLIKQKKKLLPFGKKPIRTL